MKRHFDRIHCTGCGNCVRFCPKGILKLSEVPGEQGTYITVTDESACISCRSCETMCTRGAFWFSDTETMPEDIRIMGRGGLPDSFGTSGRADGSERTCILYCQRQSDIGSDDLENRTVYRRSSEASDAFGRLFGGGNNLPVLFPSGKPSDGSDYSGNKRPDS